MILSVDRYFWWHLSVRRRRVRYFSLFSTSRLSFQTHLIFSSSSKLQWFVKLFIFSLFSQSSNFDSAKVNFWKTFCRIVIFRIFSFLSHSMLWAWLLSQRMSRFKIHRCSVRIEQRQMLGKSWKAKLDASKVFGVVFLVLENEFAIRS